MLVLTRKLNEVIVIGDGPDAVTVEVVLFKRDEVRLGITAPPDVRILRGELVAADAARREGGAA